MSMDQMKVSLINVMGDDLTVVNNARVSFDKEAHWDWDPDWGGDFKLKPEDKSLIGYLARGVRKGEWDNLVTHLFGGDLDKEVFELELKRLRTMPTHWAPFANGCQVQLHIKAPIAVMRHVFKHKVGTVESEISRRYVSGMPEVFAPEWRKAAENVKQGSSDEVFTPAPMSITFLDPNGDTAAVNFTHETLTALTLAFYDHLVNTEKVCPEQARFVLPQGTMTEARVTNSLYGWARFYQQRSDVTHAQRETAYIAEQVKAQVEPLFPVSWKELCG